MDLVNFVDLWATSPAAVGDEVSSQVMVIGTWVGRRSTRFTTFTVGTCPGA